MFVIITDYEFVNSPPSFGFRINRAESLYYSNVEIGIELADKGSIGV